MLGVAITRTAGRRRCCVEPRAFPGSRPRIGQIRTVRGFAEGGGAPREQVVFRDNPTLRECHAGMKTAIKLEPMDVNSIPFQEASLDIWDKKYRLCAKDGTPIDKTMDDTYKRVARALADVEEPEKREEWYEKFLWALRK